MDACADSLALPTQQCHEGAPSSLCVPGTCSPPSCTVFARIPLQMVMICWEPLLPLEPGFLTISKSDFPPMPSPMLTQHLGAAGARDVSVE